MAFINEQMLKILEMVPAFDGRAMIIALILAFVFSWCYYAIMGLAFPQTTLVNAEAYAADDKVNVPRMQARTTLSHISLVIVLAIAIRLYDAKTIEEGLFVAVIMFVVAIAITSINHARMKVGLGRTVMDGLHWLIVFAIIGLIMGKATLATSGGV